MSAEVIFSVKDKVALVTGAAAGLGFAMAEALAENGAHVALLDRDADLLGRASDTLRARGFAVSPFALDVREGAAVTEAVAQTLKDHGRLDICIANAGVSDSPGLPLHETAPDEWQKVVDVNMGGVFNTARAALGPMVRQGSGKLITVASMWGHCAPAGLAPRPAYAATKGAVVNLTRELAVEYAAHGIQVNAICPGFFRTETRPKDAAQEALFGAYTPMGRIAEAHEIKGTALFLASSASDFITGSSIVIDGGVMAR